MRFNCILSKSSSGQRTISSENVPLNLTIENVEKLEDDCLLIKWNESSNQKDSLLPISFLINQYPSSEFQKNEKNFKFTNVCKNVLICLEILSSIVFQLKENQVF